MTQDFKDLLLKDLCARLPYGVKFVIDNGQNNIRTLTGIDEAIPYEDWQMCACAHGISAIPIEYIKPYLFPLSSMTEEQREELFTVVLDEQVSISDCSFNDMTGYSEILTSYIIDAIDWLNKNHFDFRGLIEKSLALDATNLNIY